MWLRFVVVASWLVSSCVCDSITSSPDPCASITVRRIEDFAALRNCTIVDGSVRIVMPDFRSLPRSRHEECSTHVEEITGYLLVFRADGLTTLHDVFPNLRIIRGTDLFLNRYSLMVYQNNDLLDLGLASLLHIHKGDVLITHNYRLCYIDTIDWLSMLDRPSRQYIRATANELTNACPVCKKGMDHCWNAKEPQQQILPGSQWGQCLVQSANSSKCSLCTVFQSKNTCVDQCAPLLILHNRDCVSRANCLKQGRQPYDPHCLNECPPGHVLSTSKSHYCHHECLQDFIVRNATDLEKLRGCKNLLGSLEINLADNDDPQLISALADALKTITVIRRTLKIVNSRQLLSLNFLSNLLLVEGIDQLIEGRYSIYIANNEHLQFVNINFLRKVDNERIFIGNNPRLCSTYIKLLFRNTLTPDDPLLATNGHLAVCRYYHMSFDIVDRNATALELLISNIETPDGNILNFAFYYKEYNNALSDDVELDDVNACGYDDWLMDLRPANDFHHIITGLKPNTEYAVYIQGLYKPFRKKNAMIVSRISVVRTLALRAKPVRKLITAKVKSTEIELHWWPPLHDEIDHYIVSHQPIQLNTTTQELRKGDSESAEQSAAEETPDCVCTAKDPHGHDKMMDEHEDDLKVLQEFMGNIWRAFPHTLEPKQPTLINLFKKHFTKREVHRPTAKELLAQYPHRSGEIVHPPRVCRDDKQHFTLDLDSAGDIADDEQISDTEPCRVSEEHFPGNYVMGNRHSFTVRLLTPNSGYILSVRACAKHLLNGCSVAVYHEVKTAGVLVRSKII